MCLPVAKFCASNHLRRRWLQKRLDVFPNVRLELDLVDGTREAAVTFGLNHQADTECASEPAAEYRDCFSSSFFDSLKAELT